MMMPSYQLACVNPEHKEEQANYICKDEQCIENNPICTLCAFGAHRDHATQPIKMIATKIQRDASSFKENLTNFAQIDVLRQKLYNTCSLIHDLELRKVIRSSIDHFLSLIITKTQFDQAKLVSKQSIQQKSQKEFINSIIKYQKKCSSESIEDQKGQNMSNYTKLLKKIIEDMQEIVTNFHDIVKKGEADHSTSQLFIVQSVSKKFKFSSKFKHPKIQLTEDQIVRMPDQYVNYNYFVLCEPKISLNKPQSITFHMVNLTSYVTVGICNLNKIAKNYQFNTGQSSHGSYQISFDGYMWGDSNASINSQYTGWYFNQGDKVTLQMNPKTKKLKFFKTASPDQNYEMPVEFEKNDKMYFCVTLNSSPEEVHIVTN